MREEELQRQRQFTHPVTKTKPPLTSLTNTHITPVTPIKQLSWDEMQKKGYSLIIMKISLHDTSAYDLNYLDGSSHDQEAFSKEVSETIQGIGITETQNKPAISLHALTG